MDDTFFSFSFSFPETARNIMIKYGAGFPVKIAIGEQKFN